MHELEDDLAQAHDEISQLKNHLTECYNTVEKLKSSSYIGYVKQEIPVQKYKITFLFILNFLYNGIDYINIFDLVILFLFYTCYFKLMVFLAN